jgi:hypothetical protein
MPVTHDTSSHASAEVGTPDAFLRLKAKPSNVERNTTNKRDTLIVISVCILSSKVERSATLPVRQIGCQP